MNSTNLLRVMTFNLRVNTPNDGVNSFFNRSHRVLEAIFGEAPDIIGFQEAKDEMRSFLREKLPQYVVLGCGRSGDYSGEGIPIAYRADQFELIEWQTRWLSETPDVPGSRFGADQSKYPRIYVCAKLRRLADGKIIAFVNTHTDHEGQRARVLESDQLLKMMRALQADVIFLTGDLNAKPDSEEIQMLSADGGVGLMDATASIAGTFHNYGRRLPPWKIDYIFSTLPASECHLVEDVPVDGMYISDHNPVVATFAL